MIISTHALFNKIANSVLAGSLIYLDSRNATSYPGSGTTWFDLSGNGNDSTLVNGVTFSTNKMVFDGTNDYIQTPVSYSLGSGAINDFTVTSYFNTVTKSVSVGSSRQIVSNYQGTPIPFNVYIDITTGKIQTFSRGASSNVTLNSTTVIDNGVNHTVTYRKLGNVYSLFVDGVLEATATVNIGNCNVTNNLTLGVLAQVLNQGFYKDDYYTFLMYGSGLTDAQILSNHNAII